MMPFSIFLDRTHRWPPYRPVIVVTCDGAVHGFLPHSAVFSPIDEHPRDAAIAAGWRFTEDNEVYCPTCANRVN